MQLRSMKVALIESFQHHTAERVTLQQVEAVEDGKTPDTLTFTTAAPSGYVQDQQVTVSITSTP